jgi:hypothetical protein
MWSDMTRPAQGAHVRIAAIFTRLPGNHRGRAVINRHLSSRRAEPVHSRRQQVRLAATHHDLELWY